jgi:SET domain-containing protein
MIKSYIEVREVPGKGKGMFTKKAIKAETIIEREPVIVMTAKEKTHIDKTKLYNYIFEWQPDGQNLCCMALGLIPMYNHSYASNCEYYMDYDTDEIYVQAVRDIEAGEELTINYNATWNDESKVWFDVVE